MPQFNVWNPRNSPFGGILQGAIHHASKRAKEAYQEKSNVYKRERLYGTGEYEAPRKRAKITMPVRRFNRSKRPPMRRRFKRRYRRYRRRNYPVKFLPYERVVRAVVCKNTSLASTSGALARFSPRINDVTDPFGSGGAEQPLYFDQWAALYDKGIVLGAKLEVWFENTGTTSVEVGLMKLSVDESTGTSYNTYEYCIERGTKHRMLSPEDDRGYLQLKASAKKQLHASNMKDNDQYEMDLGSQTAPSTISYFNIWAQSVDKSTSNTVQCVIKVTYLILLKNRKVVDRSTGA